MTKLSKIVGTSLLGISLATIPLTSFAAETDAAVGQPVAQHQPGAKMLERLSSIHWTDAGVTKPAFWDSLISWLGTEDAKKVFLYEREHFPRKHPGGQKNHPPGQRLKQWKAMNPIQTQL